MNLTPDALRETTFRGALRGYNVDDVDEFVERVSDGVGQLLEQVRLASERAAAAERRAREVVSYEDEARRTLVEAQTRAEALVAEARQEAARIEAEANEGGAQVRAAAQEEVGAMLARAAERIDPDLRSEVERLQGVRQALQLDVAVLVSWMNDQRGSVRGVLVDTLAAIDRSAPAVDPPPVSDADPRIRLGGQIIAGEAEGDQQPPARPAQPAQPAPPPASAGSGGDEAAPYGDLSDDEFLAELNKAATDGDDSQLGRRGQDRTP